ncbi:MAG: sulfatase-like hydrolase/transferase, partial [Verrucomicrobia bacterium]|nr:sulfatase-like hydrolase/transferase [Verrucomicrobiota bacterium]
NGPTDNVNSGDEKTNNGHAHNGVLRGNKGSAYEGGTRVPFIARWPGHIQPGTSGALISHIDMLSTLASLTQQKLAEADAPDSHDVLGALIEGKAGRTTLVEHGNVLALRSGDWKYLVVGPGAGKKNQEKAKAKGTKKPELYDLSKDLSETTNVADQNPEVVAKMAKLLADIQAKGGSR